MLKKVLKKISTKIRFIRTSNEEYDISSALKDEGLTLEDFKEITKRLKRTPNRTELGMFGVMWSEHC